MEDLRHPEPRPAAPQPGAPLPMVPETDLARLAGEVAARAEVAAAASGVVRVTVKTTGSHAAELAATLDTTVTEVMEEACRELGVQDPARWVLVAAGEVVGDGARTVGELTGGSTDTGLVARLVKRPEAGGVVACPS